MPKILTVDQDLYILECYKKVFGPAGIEVFTAQDAMEAMQRFGECSPDIVILEVEMPGGSGKAILKKIRENFMSKVPVLFAAKNSEDLLDMSDDPDVYIVKKCFDKPAMLFTVKTILNMK